MIQRELELKEQGMNLAASANAQWLEKARALAKCLAVAHGEITIDDIRDRWPYSVPFKNWAGKLFCNGEWILIGFEKARHKGSHARRIGKWKLKQE